MQRITWAWWALVAAVTLAWMTAEPALFTVTGFVPIRNLLVQYSGLLTIAVMSIAMVMAARPRWPEQRLGGLDKMYRLHKWLGITALVTALLHWMSSNAPKWASALGLLERGAHAPRVPHADPVERWLMEYRGAAESVGEWMFYASVLLIVVALVQRVPYRLFRRTHRILAACYLGLVCHSVVLTTFTYWRSPVGLLVVPLMAAGVVAATLVLSGRVATGRKVGGVIESMRYFAGVRTLDITVTVAEGWHGHEPGQFAFVTSDTTEGAHPYTFASAWTPSTRRMEFVVKELGDHTSHLRDTLHVGQPVTIEGPYGCFTFADDCPGQVWVGGGIGISPFLARMALLADPARRTGQSIHLFHATADEDPDAFAKLTADASAAGVHLHLLVDRRDGFLSGDRIRAAVPAWRGTSIWYCGPAALGTILRRDFAGAGLDVGARFHQELFALR
ncbi:MAG: ferric reductase-like transmembrane domain-containing protein [Gemmatimonadaceae bacterium]|nr:ferric reductase-like transmembrane domain-containing protein [Gemmatimonadaceae bacterium]